MIDMEERHFAMLKAILDKFDYSFFAFGSRVTGRAKRLSDIDIFYKDAIPNSDILKLEEEFEESDLPYKVDLVDYNKCDESFKKSIGDNYVCLKVGKSSVRQLTSQDLSKLEEYLAPHKAECMFICNNIKKGGIEYNGADFQGEYFGCFDRSGNLIGVIVHYWNGNIMMHAKTNAALEKLIAHLKSHIKRPVVGILGPGAQAALVIKNLGLSDARFNLNGIEGLYEIELENFDEPNIPNNMKVVPAQDVPKNILIEWMKSYDIEALGALDDETLEKQVQEHWNLRLKQNDSWVLLLDETPVALSAFNARLSDIVQVGPVWTPPEYRNKGYARLLLAYTLFQEKLNGTKKVILFTDNPAATKAYTALGFKKIGEYCLAILERAVRLA